MGISVSPLAGADTAAPIEPRLQRAIDEVATFDGVTISITDKNKSLRKFGERTSLSTTSSTLGEFAGEAHETLLSTNGITSIVSSNAADTMTVRIEYHTISGNDLTFGVQTATLNGQTAVTLGTACARVSRLTVQGTTEAQGAIYVYEGGSITAGVPDDATEVHLQLLAGQQNSFKAATSISSVDYFIVTEVTASLLSATNLECDIDLETKSTTGVWQVALEYAIATAGTTTFFIPLDPPLIIPSNTDIRLVGKMASGTADVSGKFGGYLASVVT